MHFTEAAWGARQGGGLGALTFLSSPSARAPAATGHTHGKSQDGNPVSQPAKLASDCSVSLALPSKCDSEAVLWEYASMKE